MERVILFSVGKRTEQENRERKRRIKIKEDGRRIADHIN
jgi:hypothetical protein